MKAESHASKSQRIIYFLKIDLWFASEITTEGCSSKSKVIFNPTIMLRHSSVIIQIMLTVDNRVLSFQTELVENVKRTLAFG